MTVSRRPAETIVITGASSGIGEALAYQLASRGLESMVLTGRNTGRLAAVAERCRDLGGAHPLSLPGNILTQEHRTEIRVACEKLGRIRALVNCAGVGHFGNLELLPVEEILETIHVNLVANLLLSKTLLPLFAPKHHSPTIVNISSDADSRGFPGASVYCASKGGVLAMSRAIREDLRSRGIRVCVISPGRVDTRFNSKQPGDRPGALSADDVAEVILFSIYCGSNIELQEVRLDSMTRTG